MRPRDPANDATQRRVAAACRRSPSSTTSSDRTPGATAREGAASSRPRTSTPRPCAAPRAPTRDRRASAGSERQPRGDRRGHRDHDGVGALGVRTDPSSRDALVVVLDRVDRVTRPHVGQRRRERDGDRLVPVARTEVPVDVSARTAARRRTTPSATSSRSMGARAGEPHRHESTAHASSPSSDAARNVADGASTRLARPASSRDGVVRRLEEARPAASSDAAPASPRLPARRTRRRSRRARTSNRAAVSCTAVSPAMIHSAPSSTTAPFVRVTDQTRPPTRSLASSTVTPTPGVGERARRRQAGEPGANHDDPPLVCISDGVRTDYRHVARVGDTCSGTVRLWYSAPSALNGRSVSVGRGSEEGTTWIGRHPMENRWSRRQFLGRAAGGAVAVPSLAAILAACSKPGRRRGSGSASGTGPEIPIATPREPRRAAGDDEADRRRHADRSRAPLVLYNWVDYIHKKAGRRVRGGVRRRRSRSRPSTTWRKGIQKVATGQVQPDVFFPTTGYICEARRERSHPAAATTS